MPTLTPTSTPKQPQLTALAKACATAATAQDLWEEVSNRLNPVVQFDGAAWFATDPDTVLGTCPVRIENVEPGHCESFWDRECQVEDSLLFRDLARSAKPAATLYDVTGERPARSARWREFLAPQGYGDELRAAFRVGTSTWGVVDMFRDRDREPFSAQDVAIVQAVGPAIATALQAFSTRARQTLSELDGPGTALFDSAGRLASMDAQAEAWFTELAGPQWRTVNPHTMTGVYAVVARAAAVAEGRDAGPAAARLRTAAGRWLSIYASRMRGLDGAPGPTALTIEPAKSAQIAPIIVEAYCLTQREQEIVRGVARGLSNRELATALFLSPHTVRDHLKAVFSKVGVGSRGELVAKLFAEHYGPAMHSHDSDAVHVDY
jgi:DNA-binding CsgD family transcriptional regulator